MIDLVCLALSLFQLALLLQMVLSWLMILGVGNAVRGIDEMLRKVTEPVLGPVRKMLPRTGMFDLSFLLVFVVVGAVSRGLKCSGLF